MPPPRQVWAHKVRRERIPPDGNATKLQIGLCSVPCNSEGPSHFLWLLSSRLGGRGFHLTEHLWANHFTRRGWTFSTTNLQNSEDPNSLLHQLGKRQLWLLCAYENELTLIRSSELANAQPRTVCCRVRGQKRSLPLGRRRAHHKNEPNPGSVVCHHHAPLGSGNLLRHVIIKNTRNKAIAAGIDGEKNAKLNKNRRLENSYAGGLKHSGKIFWSNLF